MNKITNTRVGDNIHFYQNGVEDRGLVVKMNNAYVTIFKENGDFEDIQLNDTFFVKDIVLNKTWDVMNHDERLDALAKAHAPSPRYLTKTWDQLPKELQVLLVKNNASEDSAKDGKDDDMNTTVRIFDKADEPQPTEKASSGDINYKRVPSSNSAHASSDAMSTDPKSDSGGFKINQQIGAEGADSHGGHGATGRTRQQGIREREPSTEEQRGEKRGTKQTEGQAEANSKEIASSSVRLFSGYNEQTGEKEYKNQAWDLEKAIEKLNQVKSNIENSVHGNAGREPNSGVSTSTNFDAPKDYEGASHSGIRPEQFKHENKKPEVKKEKLNLGDTKPSDTQDGGNKYDTKTQPKTINGRVADQKKDTI